MMEQACFQGKKFRGQCVNLAGSQTQFWTSTNPHKIDCWEQQQVFCSWECPSTYNMLSVRDVTLCMEEYNLPEMYSSVTVTVNRFQDFLEMSRSLEENRSCQEWRNKRGEYEEDGIHIRETLKSVNLAFQSSISSSLPSDILPPSHSMLLSFTTFKIPLIKGCQ